ncbi:hypothetical protein E3E36_02030 [Thermococcus sp. M36]|uniref:DUF5658 family protein n=1 Tax=Thermococcus sp. M36 TaxID=1638261 RepID=UPI0016BD3714|nr:DUF5658 family protein [Thermococcus sp. M36]NJE04948.1 hypothetical protein [Thermococcus sp. M36]
MRVHTPHLPAGSLLVYPAVFLLLSALDLLTTLAGVRMGHAEINPAMAGRMSSPYLFIGSYAAYTAIGVAVLVVALKLEKLSVAFRYFAEFFVALRALPVVNNALILLGI